MGISGTEPAMYGSNTVYKAEGNVVLRARQNLEDTPLPIVNTGDTATWYTNSTGKVVSPEGKPATTPLNILDYQKSGNTHNVTYTNRGENGTTTNTVSWNPTGTPYAGNPSVFLDLGTVPKQ